MKSLWEREGGVWWNGDVNFSSCGKFVLIAGQEERVPIPDAYLSLLPDRSYSICYQDKRTPSAESVVRFGNTGGSSFNFCSGQLISSASSKIVSGGTGLRTISVGDSDAITLISQDAGGKEESRLHLLSIPRWNQYQNTAQTIFVPAKDSNEFTIVQEKSLEKAYNLDRKQEQHFPLAVKRDVSDIYYYETRRDASSNEAEGDTDRNIEKRDGKRPRNK
jgi:hypothetical protein